MPAAGPAASRPPNVAVAVATDAAAMVALDADVDAAVGVPIDARAEPTQPRTTYPIITVEFVRNGTLVTIAAGKRRGVSMSWKGYSIDAEGSRLSGGDLVINVVQDRTTVATSKLTLAQLGSRRVEAHLTP